LYGLINCIVFAAYVVYPWFNILLMCIFQINFSSKCCLRYFTESSLLFHLISWLLICSKVGFLYLLSVNIFGSLLIGFIVCFHFENHRKSSSRELCRSLLKMYKLGFALNNFQVNVVQYLNLIIFTKPNKLL